MIYFRVLLTGLAVISALSACHPNDQRAKTVREQLEDGDTVVFDKTGWRYKGCPSRAPDWSDMRLNDQVERARIVVGKQGSLVSPGIFSCYRVGSRIALNASKGAVANEGVVQITKLAWARVDKLSKYAMSGKYFASSEEFNRYLDNVKMRMQPKHQGLVTVVDFVYISGSAADEKSIIDREEEKEAGDGYEETKNDGDSLSSCKKEWSDLIVNKNFQPEIDKGYLKSWFDLGQRSCFKQGAVVALKEKIGEGPSMAMVKITKLKRFRAKFLDSKFFSLHGADWPLLKAEILLQNSTKNEEFMTVIDFEVLP